MPTQFVEKALGECLSLVIDHRGKTPKKLGADWVDAGVPTISAKNVNGGRLVNRQSIRYVSPGVYRRWMKEDVQRGDCLLVSEGATLGECMLWDDDYPVVLGQRIFCLRANPDVLSPRFLYAYMTSRSFQDEIIGRATGTSVDGLRQAEVLKLKLRLPPIKQQEQIGDILYNLNTKIELNGRMNSTLEAMARTLFQSWFVDFDPVRAKLDGRQPKGLDEASASLFPAQLSDSVDGFFPKGWEIRPLDKIAHFLNGLALQKHPPAGGPTLPVIKIAQLRKSDTSGADRCAADLPPEYVVNDGDVLFSWSGSLEVELWCGGQGALNQHLFKVTSGEFPRWFYYLWTLFHLDEFRLIAADKATTMGHIQRRHLTAAKVLIPPRPLLDAMTDIMGPIVDQLVANRIQSRTLAALRDTLLPKLLSGELEVLSTTGA